jgi:hypothetical protein
MKANERRGFTALGHTGMAFGSHRVSKSGQDWRNQITFHPHADIKSPHHWAMARAGWAVASSAKTAGIEMVPVLLA